jgi:site-specific DNA-methyltransferase (adenine-specific)
MYPKNSNKMRAPRNKTISITNDEIDSLKRELVHINQPVSLGEVQNKIINQDIFTVIDHLPSKFVDLIFVDPPYNLNKTFNQTKFTSMESSKYEAWLDSWINKLVRLLKDDASIYICGDWKSAGALFNVASKYFIIQNRITWEREKGRGALMNWKNCSEDIWFCTLSEKYQFNINSVKMKKKVIAPYRDESGKPKDWEDNENGRYRITHPSNLWTDITVPFWSMPENTDHPTQKPEKLVAKIILASSKEGDMVFDPFLGSGTTSVVAQKLGRKHLGIEIDTYYSCLAQKRLQMAETDTSIQGYTDGIFWERNSLAAQLNNSGLNKKIISLDYETPNIKLAS